MYRSGLVLLLLIPLMLSLTSADTLPRADGKWVIVIDPGHGGRDPGALGSFSRESDINLAIALKTGDYISKNINNVTVLYTRKDDSTVDLIDRPKFANKNNADLFISIHTNSTTTKSVVGTETFIMGLAKDDANLEVAMKENEVILLEDNHEAKYQNFDPKSPESYIIFTLTQNVFQKQSTDIASKVQSQFTDRAGRHDRGVKQQGFWVLYNTAMPAILIETGFITNVNEEKFLNSSQGQDIIASAIFRACRDYITDLDMKSNISIAAADKTIVNNQDSEAVTSDKIIFMVQIASSSSKKDLSKEKFSGVDKISEIEAQGRYKYAAGTFSDYLQAVAYRKKLEITYPDAFVIAVRENKIIPLQQALEQARTMK